MKIAVNLFSTSPRSVTGAFVYIQQILPELFSTDPEHTYYLFGERETIEYFKSLYGNLPNVRFRAFGIGSGIWKSPVKALQKLAAKVRRDYLARERLIAEEMQGIIRTEDIQVYFSPSSAIYPRGLIGVRAVTTIHDLQHEYFPENFPPHSLTAKKEAHAYAVKHSDRIIAVSENTKESLREVHDADPEKVSVIYHAPKDRIEDAEDFVVPQEFIFYPAALWPHKNHRILIRALGILKDRFPSLHAVCAGMTKGGGFKKELMAEADAQGLAGRVIFMDYVSDSHMPKLYKRAKALVFPSAFEGFGIPLIEAFHYGTPVIAADNSSITEVVDGAGMLVKTGDAEALAEAIGKVLRDTALRDNLIAKGHARVKDFSWKKAARGTLEVFQRESS